MKHSMKITLFLVLLFFTAQVVGLEAVRQTIDIEKFVETGMINYVPLAGNISRPDVEPTYSVLWILIAVIIGTVLFFILIRFKQRNIWKTWFFLSVLITLSFCFNAFLKNGWIAFLIAAALATWKVYKPNMFVHNLTEIFIYGGLAVIFVPVMNITAGVILLLIISAYDMYAVWKSKHMIKLAKFQAKSKIFAGILIPYQKLPTPKKGQKVVKKKIRTAVLGGGDIGFPLIFNGIVMHDLIMSYGLSMGFFMSLIVTISTTIALLFLFLKAEKDKFYPAMPFISIGCFAGYLLVLLVQALI